MHFSSASEVTTIWRYTNVYIIIIIIISEMFAYSIAFAVVRHSLKEPPQPGIIVSPAGMSLARAVPETKVTSAGEILGIPGGNSSPA